MSGTIQRSSCALDASPWSPDHSLAMVWTLPETNSSLVGRRWNYVRDALALREKTKTRKGPMSIYPPSLSTQAENRILLLDAYGITINHTIRRMDYGGVFAEQRTYKKTNKKACTHVRVGSEEISEFIRDVIEIRNRYRSQKMFTSLVESKLLKAPPLVYRLEEGPGGVWRPERCFDLGGQELQGLGWCFPPLVSPLSVEGDAEPVEAREFSVENVWTGIEDLSNYGEPLFGTETSEAGQNKNTVQLLPEGRSSEDGVAKLTFENLRALNRANTLANEDSEAEAAIPQLDGVMDLAHSLTPEHFRDMIFSEKIYSPNTAVQDVKIQNVYANAIILSPLNDQGTHCNSTAGIIHKLLSKFYLRAGKRSPLHQLSKFQYHGKSRELDLEANDRTDMENQVAPCTTNLDPFNEDDPKTKYLSTPFQTERYHILSKWTQYADPYTPPPISIPHHPVLFNPPPRTPWRAPSVSYWCRPVNVDFPDMQGDMTSNGNEGPEDQQDPSSTRFLRSISGLNNITSPYLSIQYADTTRAYNSWEFRNCVETALVDLHVAMATGVYNRCLGYLHGSGDGEGNDGANSRDDGENERQQVLDKSLRHYGVCIGLAGFSCWVAEPDLSRAHGDEDISITSDMSTGACTQTGTLGPSRLGWRGCTITKVMEGQVNKHMDMGGLVDFINRAHEYGMGSFIHGVATDFGLGGCEDAVGRETADVELEGSETNSDGELEEEEQDGEFTASSYLEGEGMQVEEFDGTDSDELGGFCQEGEENGDESSECGERDRGGVELGSGSEDGDGSDSTIAGDEDSGTVEQDSIDQGMLSGLMDTMKSGKPVKRH